MLIKINFIILFIGLFSFISSNDNIFDENKSAEIQQPIFRIINGYVATCKRTCEGEYSHLAIGCTYVDEQFKIHYSHGHCPENSVYYRQMMQKYNLDKSK